jgi:hypothetical protein
MANNENPAKPCKPAYEQSCWLMNKFAAADLKR